MSRLIILGGTGFIGSHLVKKLISHKKEIILIGRRKLKSDDSLNKFINNKKVRYFQLDLKNLKKIINIIYPQDYVFNLITYSTPFSSSLFPLKEIREHLYYQIRLIKYLFKKKVKKIIFFSSGGGIYDTGKKPPFSEESLILPHSPHAITKITIEYYLNFFSNLYSVPYLCYRISNVYGPGQEIKKGFGIISNLINSIKNNKKIVLYGGREIVRDFIYIEDLIEAVSISFWKKNKFNVYNIGSGVGTSIFEIWSILKKISKTHLQPIIKKPRIIDVKKVILNINRFSKEYNWKPKTRINEGLKKTYFST